MSGFDDNPFGDSPFQDPTIQQATKKPPGGGGNDLEDYNPFDDGPQGQRPTTVQQTSTQEGVDPAVRGASNPPQYGGMGTTDQSRSPAVMSPTVDNPPPYGGSQQKAPPISTAELQRRQEELERKARELERREAELNNAPLNARRNNWPPLPEAFPLQPCFYQDINVDIPVEFQRIVRYLYYVWILHAGLLVVNFVIQFIRLVSHGEIKDFFASMIFLIIFIPASYICWFRPAYKAFKSDSSFNFMVFFFVFFAQFLTSIAFSTFVSSTCGIVEAIGTIKTGGVGYVIIGILMLLVGIGFLATAVIDFMLLMRVHAIYRSSGASFAKAQQEFASGVMRNEHVQGAATNIASEAIRAQMGGGGGNNANNANPNAPRY